MPVNAAALSAGLTPSVVVPRYSHELGESRYGAHRLVLGFVGKGHRVLDVGAGEGALSQRLAEEGNEVVSVERDSTLAQAAADRGLRVAVRDIERESIADLGTFDVIVCADVLEHLLDPAAALAKLRDCLAPAGRLVCSIPNVAFYTVRLELLRGSFEYTEGGILDRTHMKFFTHRSAHALMEAGNFRIVREEVSHYLSLWPPSLSRVFNEKVERGRFGLAVHRFCLAFPGLFGYQFVTESVRASGNAPDATGGH